MPNNNPTGQNGTDTGEWPPDEILRKTLLGYAAKQLSVSEQLRRLGDDHNLHIKKTLFYKTIKRLNIPTQRKSGLSKQHQTQLVLNEIEADTNAQNGANHIKDLLAMKGYRGVPRSLVRDVCNSYTPEQVDARFPGKRTIPRTTLHCAGVFAEVAADGHDKANAQALRLGSASLPIYGFCDQFSRAILHLVVVPNDRLATTIGHVYLDFVEAYQAIPIKLAVDKGSETGEMYAMQKALRQTYAPDIDESIHPSFVALKSIHNITIEGIWRWFRQKYEKSFIEKVKLGYNTGLFNPNDPIHLALFYWIWPPVFQSVLDEFVDLWNTHKLRNQKQKDLPSGAAPEAIYHSPSHFGGQRCSIPIEQAVIDRFRNDIEISRKDAYKFVDEDFAALATHVWEGMGSPACDTQTAWQLFELMIATEEIQTYNSA